MECSRHADGDRHMSGKRHVERICCLRQRFELLRIKPWVHLYEVVTCRVLLFDKLPCLVRPIHRTTIQ